MLASGEETYGLHSFGFDGDAVYWGSSAQGGSARKVDKDGGEPITLASGLGPIGPLVVDAQAVYLAAGDRLLAIPREGGEPALLATSPEGPPWQMTHDEAALYWTSPPSGVISVLPKQAGAAVALYPHVLTPASGIAVDATHYYWSSKDDGLRSELKSAPMGAELLVTDNGWALAVDDERIYYTAADGSVGQLRSVPKTGGDPAALSDFEPMKGVALDEEFVYWAAQAGGGRPGGIRKVSKGGGDVVELATDPTAALLAVDKACVYWMNHEGLIQRAPR